ncbi:hypothetical protein NFJ02_05g123880 [Pycnococcus provasolii]
MSTTRPCCESSGTRTRRRATQRGGTSTCPPLTSPRRSTRTAHAQTQPLKPRAGLGLEAASSGLESGLGPSLSLAQKPTVAHALAKRVGKMNKRMNAQEEAGGAPRLAAVPPASKPRKRFVRDHDESDDEDDDDENDGGRGGGGRRDAFGASKLSRQPLWSQLVPKKKNKKSKKKKTAL